MTGAAGAAFRTLERAIEEEEMTLFAESKENLSIAHSSSTALPKLSGFPGGDCVLVVQFIMSAVTCNDLSLIWSPFHGEEPANRRA